MGVVWWTMGRGRVRYNRRSLGVYFLCGTIYSGWCLLFLLAGVCRGSPPIYRGWCLLFLLAGVCRGSPPIYSGWCLLFLLAGVCRGSPPIYSGWCLLFLLAGVCRGSPPIYSGWCLLFLLAGVCRGSNKHQPLYIVPHRKRTPRLLLLYLTLPLHIVYKTTHILTKQSLTHLYGRPGGTCCDPPLSGIPTLTTECPVSGIPTLKSALRNKSNRTI